MSHKTNLAPDLGRRWNNRARAAAWPFSRGGCLPVGSYFPTPHSNPTPPPLNRRLEGDATLPNDNITGESFSGACVGMAMLSAGLTAAAEDTCDGAEGVC